MKRKTKRKPRQNGANGYFLIAVAAAIAMVIFPRLPFAEWLDTIYAYTNLSHTTVAEIEGDLRVHIIDVGQGDCALIQTPEQNILIDSGEANNAASVASYLRALGVDRLDMAIATHPHTDHIGGLYSLAQEFDPTVILTPRVPDDLLPTHSAYDKLSDAFESGQLTQEFARQNEVYELGGGVTMTILGPPEDERYNGLNLYSIVCRIDYGETSFMFTGDMEAPNELALINAYDTAMLRADVLKLGHHGSKTSSTARWLDAVSPRTAVAGIGADNDYGHPHSGVTDRLARRGIELYRTDLDGSVAFGSNGTDITISTSKATDTRAAA